MRLNLSDKSHSVHGKEKGHEHLEVYTRFVVNDNQIFPKNYTHAHNV